MKGEVEVERPRGGGRPWSEQKWKRWPRRSSEQPFIAQVISGLDAAVCERPDGAISILKERSDRNSVPVIPFQGCPSEPTPLSTFARSKNSTFESSTTPTKRGLDLVPVLGMIA